MRKIQIKPHLRQQADDLMRRLHRTNRDTSLATVQESLQIIQTPNGDISSSAITLGGDVTGRGSNNTVVRLRNLPLPVPSTTDTVLAFISGALTWVSRFAGHLIEDEGVAAPQREVLNFVGSGVSVTDTGGKTTVNVPGTTIPDHAGDVTGPHPTTVVVGLRSTPLADTAPSDAQVLAFNSTLGQWAPKTLESSSLGTRWEPVTNGDVDNPELVFDNGDVIMEEVAL